jgi:type VI secretion system secreted protein Hcp
MATDFLLEIDGIKGESGDGKLKDCIEIDSFTLSCSNSGSHSGGGGGGTGKVSFDDIRFNTSANKASPLLMLFCASGKDIKKAVLHVRKQGGEQQEYYTITLEKLVVSSYSSNGNSGATIPMDSFSLDFTSIKFEYKPQKDDQTLDAAVTGGWDVKKGEAVS